MLASEDVMSDGRKVSCKQWKSCADDISREDHAREGRRRVGLMAVDDIIQDRQDDDVDAEAEEGGGDNGHDPAGFCFPNGTLSAWGLHFCCCCSRVALGGGKGLTVRLGSSSMRIRTARAVASRLRSEPSDEMECQSGIRLAMTVTRRGEHLAYPHARFGYTLSIILCYTLEIVP